MSWSSAKNPAFRNEFSEKIFYQKYAHEGARTWNELANTLVQDVCGDCADRIGRDFLPEMKKAIQEMKFIPGGRYLYYAGRSRKFFSNCYLLSGLEDTREDWSAIAEKATSCLATGGGIGVDYSVYRPSGSLLSGTGGVASGPIALMNMVNEIGRNIMQGGSRRSAIYGSLNWKHGDAKDFLKVKDWHNYKVGATGQTLWDIKQQDFNFNAPMDMTNISLNYDTDWLMGYWNKGELGDIFIENTRNALKTGEPGFSFNFFGKEKETLRNAPLAGDTRVLTDQGYVSIKDCLTQEVNVWTGHQFTPTNFLKTKECVPTIKINMTGGRSIVADPDHEFFVDVYKNNGNKFVETIKVKAKDLRRNDRLNVRLPEIAITEEDVEDRKWAYLYGFMYGDGSFNRHNGGEFTICADNKYPCLNRMNKNYISSITEVDSRGYLRAYVKSHSFRHVDKNYVPELTPGLLVEFIAGLFDADGSYDIAQNRVRLSSVKRDFLSQIREELERFGISSSINIGSICRFSNTASFMLVIHGSSIKKFSEIIPTERLKITNRNPYRESRVRVLSIEQDKVQDVYCCDVRVPEHSFVAEGVVVSNCTEVTSEDDSDVCNLGSINMSRISDIAEFTKIVELGTIFLLLGTLKADLPYDKVYQVRQKNRRLGLGLMGMSEWLMQRGYKYEVTEELHRWLEIYKQVSDDCSGKYSSVLGISKPVANRAIAPTGTIGILAGSTTGLEPLFSVAYKRRYLKGTKWHYQYVVDGAAKDLIERYAVDPDNIDTALSMASDFERRVKFQYDVQKYVDMAISSTINLPAWGTKHNNEDTVIPFASTLAKYAHGLRGFTCYPDGSRGGQPLTQVPYSEAIKHLGEEYEETYHDVCTITGHGGSCGV